MSKLAKKIKKKFSIMERGQVLVVVTLAAFGIIAIVGLALDVGIMFIDNARLRRAVDAAALGAALQVRENYTETDLLRAANEFMFLNDISLDPKYPIVIETCESPGSTLCVDPISGQTITRKLVKVTVTAEVHLAFLPVIGIDRLPITATSTSETASVDVVLLLDTSASMSFNNPSDHPDLFDPSVCNKPDPATYPDFNSDGVDASGYQGNCAPFHKVKTSAVTFVNKLFFPYDRVSIVTFDKAPTEVLTFADNCPSGSCTVSDGPGIKNMVIDKIKKLKVYEGDGTYAGGGNPSRCYMGDPAQVAAGWCKENPSFYNDPNTGANSWNFMGLQCPMADVAPPDPHAGDWSQCGSTNLGGGLELAGGEFAGGGTRTESLWVVVLLTDGLANEGYSFDKTQPKPYPIDHYFCPLSTWTFDPRCNDANPFTRHLATDLTSYDTEDYAYDMADFVGETETATTHGQGAIIFSIGLGADVRSHGVVGPDGITKYPGEELLKYAAAEPRSIPPGRGEYFYAPNDEQLQEIFRKIADNIAIRLTH